MRLGAFLLYKKWGTSATKNDHIGVDAGKNFMTAGGAEAVLEMCRCGSDFGDVTALFPEMRMGVKFKNPLPRNNFCKQKT